MRLSNRYFEGLMAALFLCTMTSTASSTSLNFVALGDTAYNVPADYPEYLALIHHINETAVEFILHIGDTKGAGGACDEARQQVIKKWFGEFYRPLIYTPGDNEWTDCANPLASLAAIRTVLFSNDRGLGRTAISLTRQSDISSYIEFVENQRWSTGEVQFLTIHVVGSQNNSQSPLEHKSRDAANVAWLKDTFGLAKEKKIRAIVIGLHAEMWRSKSEERPYRTIIHALVNESKDFDGQVLLIHGDTHTYTVDSPSAFSGSGNVRRLEVYGSPDIKAVMVNIDTESHQMFEFHEISKPIDGSPSSECLGLEVWEHGYSNSRMAGKRRCFINSVGDASQYGFNDVASSACAHKGTWLLYENTTFNRNVKGREIELKEGVCKDRFSSSSFNDKMSSVRKK